MLWAYKGLCWGLGLMFSIINESLRCKQGLSWELYKKNSSHNCIISILSHAKLCLFVSSSNSDNFTSTSSDGKSWRIWMKMILQSSKWWMAIITSLMSFSFHMKWKKGQVNLWTPMLVFEMFQLQCEPHQPYSKLWPTLQWKNLTNWHLWWCLQSSPMHDLHVSF